MPGGLRGSILTLGQRARQKAHRAASTVMLRAAEAVVEQERSRWPRDSGESAALLDAEPTRTGVRVVGRANYTTAIVTRGGRRPWRELVQRLNLQMAREVPRAVAAEILRALRAP